MHFTFSMPRTALAVGIAMVLSAPVLAADCKPSKWGKDDQVGNVKYITPQSVMQVFASGQHNGRSMARDFGWDITYLDDLAQLWFGSGPQIDGLGHLGESVVY